MVPSKLKRHLTTKRLDESLKTRPYFEPLLNSNKKVAFNIIKRVTISDKVLEELFKVAELIAKHINSHVIGEKLIGPTYLAVVKNLKI